MAMTTPCREWQGPTAGGYGVRYRDGRNQYIHRWVVEQIDGPIPEGSVVMHLCHNPPCFRYDHLKVGSQSENIKMARELGHINTQKLTREDVEAIRSASGLQREIAAEFGISQTHVSRIKKESVWT